MAASPYKKPAPLNKSANTMFDKPKTGSSLLNSIPNLQKGLGSAKSFQPNYKVGDTVKHIKFGTGMITKMQQSGNDYEVTVDFEGSGQRKLRASVARLKKI